MQEIALVAAMIAGAVELRPIGALDPSDVVARRQSFGAEVTRQAQ